MIFIAVYLLETKIPFAQTAGDFCFLKIDKRAGKAIIKMFYN